MLEITYLLHCFWLKFSGCTKTGGIKICSQVLVLQKKLLEVAARVAT